MEAKKFKVIIVEDVKLELKGTEEIFRHEIPEAEIIGTAMTEQEFWSLMEAGVPDLVMDGKKLVFNYPILEKIVERFKTSVLNDAKRQEAIICYDIDEYDERFLRHLALGYTKEMIASLKGMPFGVKSLEKRQNDLVGRLFSASERIGVNATRLVVRALELRILDIDNLEADDE